MPTPSPYVKVNLREVNTRNETARQIVAEFTAAMPTMADIWRHFDRALTDAVALADEVTRLADELAAVRLDRANLHAAARATIAAAAEGEPDPLSYLRDELDAAHSAPESRARGRA
jgi:hypothetical protein